MAKGPAFHTGKFLQIKKKWSRKFLRINKNGAVLQRSVTQLVPRLSKRRNNGASPAFHPAFFFPCRFDILGHRGSIPKNSKWL